MENPYTQYLTEPSGETHVLPGEISYYPITEYLITVGYKIKGIGDEIDKVVVELSLYDDEREQTVVAACMNLYSTYFSQFSEGYPSDLSVVSTTGQTLQDYMDIYPNPYTNTVCSLVLGIAHNPGEVGYLPVTENDVVTGAIVTGVGEIENDIIFYINHRPLQPCH